MFQVSLDGIKEVGEIPGLTREERAGTTRYTYDLRFVLQENSFALLLLQSLEEQRVDLAFTWDIPVGERLGESSGGDMLCLGTSIQEIRGDEGFYVERAQGRPGTPPPVSEEGLTDGGHMGHATAGPLDYIEAVFGDRITVSDRATWKLANGTYVLFANGISQYSSTAVQNDDVTWQQTFVVPGKHRVLSIPTAPLYCHRGFGEFEDAQIIGTPPLEVANGGHREIETRYGSYVAFNTGEPVAGAAAGASPTNSARVDFLGVSCRAGTDRPIHLSTFEAGVVRAEVETWTGQPILVLSGLASGQGPPEFGHGPRDQCQP